MGLRRGLGRRAERECIRLGKQKEIADGSCTGEPVARPQFYASAARYRKMRNRRSTRLPKYDYTRSGVYFVTICTYRFASLFGRIVNGNVQLNSLGRLVEEEWRRTELVRPSVDVDLFVVMPNHLHGLLSISDCQAEQIPERAATMRANSLGSIIAQFKSKVTKRSRRLANPRSVPIWKRNYYDHIVRNERSLARIRNYILENPSRWNDDRYYRD